MVRVELCTERKAGNDKIQLLCRLIAPCQDPGRRRPVHLALVIDRSSSMRGPRLSQAVQAARQLIDQLGPKDRLSIVTFDAAPTVICDPGPVTEERKLEMDAALHSITTGVGTNLGAAMRAGADLLRASYVRECVARVLLLTDGQASVGITDSVRLGAMSEAIYKAGVTTTTMGLGQGFDDDLLIDIATRGHGSYYYLANASDIPAAFGRELDGVFSISAQNTQVRLIAHPDVESIELVHKLPSESLEDGLLVRVGDVSASAPRHILFNLCIRSGSQSSSAGKLSVTFTDATGSNTDAHIVGITIPESPTQPEIEAIVSEDLRLRVAHAVDKAWGQRTSGSSGRALLALRHIHRTIEEEKQANRCPSAVAQDLFNDLAQAEIAIRQGTKEIESVRRGLREKSQMTQMGHSVLHKLTPKP